MGWHEEFKVTVFVDGDEGTIKINSPELFNYFSERKPILEEGGHEFPMAIYDYKKKSPIYWVSAIGLTTKQER